MPNTYEQRILEAWGAVHNALDATEIRLISAGPKEAVFGFLDEADCQHASHRYHLIVGVLRHILPVWSPRVRLVMIPKGETDKEL